MQSLCSVPSVVCVCVSSAVAVLCTGELVVEAEPEQSAIEGETATLRCNVTSFPEPRITWYSVEAPGTVNEVQTELTRQVSTDRNFGVYRIPSADQSDAGLYRCTGRYDFGDETKDITLVVLSKCRSNRGCSVLC